ncbi:hypothetical protein F5051DRAFT_415514 [Lentinula edodes]|nr:hypothetical protein F5051DRAFT_415514 [Lentinula edodes]
MPLVLLCLCSYSSEIISLVPRYYIHSLALRLSDTNSPSTRTGRPQYSPLIRDTLLLLPFYLSANFPLERDSFLPPA